MSDKVSAISNDELKTEIQQLIAQQQSLIMASQSEQLQSLASYAPFVYDSGVFYLLLSDLASHSINLRCHAAQKKTVSVLLIEDEKYARNIFARKRLNYDCHIEIWTREQPDWTAVMERLEQRFGNTIELLAGLADFNLYCLSPEHGHYVRGFGQAYELQGAVEPVHINKPGK